jgi:hypothetical protein
MSRMLFATAIAVASNVGAFAMAGESLPEGSDDSFRVPAPVIDFLNEPDRTDRQAQTMLYPLQNVGAELFTEPNVSRIHSPIVPADIAQASPELTPVPLPAPVWTGAAGLLGLGVLQRFRKPGWRV